MFAQDPIAVKLTEKEGLPDVEFYDIVDDNEGFVWLAADKGLFRYDGKNYKSFTNENKRGLSIFNLKFDSQKRLWCNNISGQFFYVKNDKLELFLDLKNELKGELADFLFNEDKMFIFGIGTILEIDLKTKERKNIWDIINLPLKHIRSPFLKENKIYFTINSQIYYLSKGTIVQVTSDKINEFNDKSTSKIFTYNDSLYLNIYEVKSNENHFYKIIKNKLQPVLLPKILEKNKIITVLEQDNLLWFCTQKGLLSMEIKKDNFTVKDIFFKDDFITKMIVDKNKSIWLTTINNGVLIVPDLKVREFKKIIPNSVISKIEKIEDNLIAIGTLNGDVFLKDLNNNTHIKISLDTKSKVSSLLFLREEETLLISTDNTSYSYNVITNELKRIDKFNSAKDLQQIGQTNKFICCGFDRATILEYKNKNVTLFKALDYNRSYKTFYDENTKEIYIIYVDNLVRYNANFDSEILTYNGESIIANDICKTIDGTLWIATYNEGILTYQNKKFINKLDVSKGLISNQIEQIKSDNHNLWIITGKGLQIYNTKQNKFKPSLLSNSTLNGNVKDVIFNQSDALFSTQEDFLIISKNKPPKKYIPNEIYIQSIAINERDTVVKKNYTLPYDKNRIRFSFHVNGYFPKEELVYEYRLNGLNEDWIKLDKDLSFVNFNTLPPKDYTFEVRVKNDFDEKYATTGISFQINQPYWKKWWFITLLILLSFGLVVLFYRNKLAVQEKEKELALKKAKFENELAILKLENLKSQMNPHFIFNALNSIQEYIVLSQKDLASSYLAKFADLIRAYLDHSSKGYISLNEEIECLDIYLQLEKLRFEEKFSYKINSSENNKEVKIPTMLIQPYVENAIKHGLLHKKEDRVLEIFFEIMEEEQMLKCVVLDNGIGRKRASQLRNKKHQSFATKATQNRLELLNFGKERKIGVTIDDLMNEKKEPIGTKVILLIPILK